MIKATIAQSNTTPSLEPGAAHQRQNWKIPPTPRRVHNTHVHINSAGRASAQAGGRSYLERLGGGGGAPDDGERVAAVDPAGTTTGPRRERSRARGGGGEEQRVEAERVRGHPETMRRPAMPPPRGEKRRWRRGEEARRGVRWGGVALAPRKEAGKGREILWSGRWGGYAFASLVVPKIHNERTDGAVCTDTSRDFSLFFLFFLFFFFFLCVCFYLSLLFAFLLEFSFAALFGVFNTRWHMHWQVHSLLSWDVGVYRIREWFFFSGQINVHSCFSWGK